LQIAGCYFIFFATDYTDQHRLSSAADETAGKEAETEANDQSDLYVLDKKTNGQSYQDDRYNTYPLSWLHVGLLVF
jgi:hypothetical protein